MENLKGAIIGCGTIASSAHLPAFNSLKQVEIIALIDSDIKQAKRLAKKFQIKEVFTEYDQLIDRDDIDFVCITTPPQYHAEIAIELMKSKKHVLIEKPMTLTVKEAKTIEQVSKQNDVIAGVVHNRRFFSTIQKTKKAIEEGRLGDIYHANFQSHVSGPSVGYPASRWHFDVEKCGGGVLMDQGTHTFDLVRHLLGEINSIYTIDSTIFKGLNTDTSALSVLECGDITKCSVELSWTSDFTECPITIWGSAGVIFTEPMFGYYEEVHEPRNPVKRWLNMTRTLTRFTTSFATKRLENTHRELIKNYARSISKDRRPNVTSEDGLKSIEVVHAAYDSIRSRSIIDL